MMNSNIFRNSKKSNNVFLSLLKQMNYKMKFFLLKKTFKENITKKVSNISFHKNNTKVFPSVKKLFLASNNNCNSCGTSVLYNINSSKTILTRSISANCVSHRAMHRATNTIHHHGTPLLLHTPRITINMSVKAAVKLKKQAVTDLANDNTGKHTHVMTQTCVQTDCETKKCQNLCDTLKESVPKGHNTHKPPIGRFCRFVSETDANGKTDAQYFVPVNENKKVTASQMSFYGTNIKTDYKQQPFVDQNKDKYE